MVMFLEERLPENIDYGSGFAAAYSNQIVRTVGGNEYRKQRHPYVMASLSIDFERQTNFIVEDIIDLNNRAGGTLRGFRVKHPVDFTTNNYRDTPTAFDQHLPLATSGVPAIYQLTRWYGDYSTGDCARRRIRKPVSGSALIGVGGAVYPAAQWSVDITTGLVTWADNKSRSITAITQASSAVLTVGAHTFVVGNSVVISGVAGMTQINNLRALVTAVGGTTITVAINSALFSAYTSGGTVQTQTIAGEVVTAGAMFDIPMRFDADLGGDFSNWDTVNLSGIQLTEILNP